MPVFHVEPAQSRSTSRICSGRASVVTSRSPGARGVPDPAASSASRTDPPTTCASKPAAVKRSPSSVSTGVNSTSSRTVSCTAGGTGSRSGRLGGSADTTSQGSGESRATLLAWLGRAGAGGPGGRWRGAARPPVAPGRRDLRGGPGGRRRRGERAPCCPHRPHGSPRSPPLVAAQGAHRGGGNPRGHRRPRGGGGDRGNGRGRRPPRHHRLLVRRRGPPRAQDGAPLPAPRDRGSALRCRHRGDRGRMGAPLRALRSSGLRRRAGTGRAGTRPAGRQRVSSPAAGIAPADGRRPGLLSALASAALCLVALGGSVVLGTPHAHAAPDDDTRDDGRPGSTAISPLAPRSVAPGAVVTVSGTLTNTGGQTVTDLGVRLQRGEVMTTRAELSGADTSADPDTTVVPAFQDTGFALDPGASRQFSYTIPADALQLTQAGVYPVLLNVNCTTDGGERRRVGELATYLVQQPPTGRATVAWLWPLVERSHRDASGGFVDDGLAASVRQGGRLDRALSVVEDLPRTTPAGGGTPIPTVPVTLAVDPALVEELETMAAGPYAVDGKAGAGDGTDDAAAFLQRLRAVAAVHPVVALPYGDV